jgi:hypothetical protein
LVSRFIAAASIPAQKAHSEIARNKRKRAIPPRVDRRFHITIVTMMEMNAVMNWAIAYADNSKFIVLVMKDVIY